MAFMMTACLEAAIRMFILVSIKLMNSRQGCNHSSSFPIPYNVNYFLFKDAVDG